MTSRWNLNSEINAGTDATLAKKVKQCYTDVSVSGSSLTLSNTNSGVSKTVVVSGGTSSSIQAFNDATLAGNNIEFASTTGVAADSVTIDLANSTLGTTVGTLESNGLKTIELDGNGDLRGKRHDSSYSGKIEDLGNCFKSATVVGSNLTLTPLSGTDTTLALPTGDTAIVDVQQGLSASGNEIYFYNASNSAKTTADYTITIPSGTTASTSADYKIKIIGSPHQSGYTGKYLVTAEIKLQNISTGAYITLSNSSASSVGGSNASNRAIDGSFNSQWLSLNANGNGSSIEDIWWKADATLDSNVSYRIHVTGRDRLNNESSPVIVQIFDSSETNMLEESPILTHYIYGVDSQETATWDFVIPTFDSANSITFDVSVQLTGGSNKYFINTFRGSAVNIELLAGHKYVFNYPASHPLRFSSTNDGTHNSGVEYTSGITHSSPDGVNQTRTELIVGTGVDALYYYCENHANMGGAVLLSFGHKAISNISFNQTTSQLNFSRPYLADISVTLPQYKAKGSFSRTAGSSGSGNLSAEYNVSGIAENYNSFNQTGYWNISGNYHSWFRLTVTFTTPLANSNYQVLVTEASTASSGHIMNSAIRNKSTSAFDVLVYVNEPSATTNNAWGFDFVVF